MLVKQPYTKVPYFWSDLYGNRLIGALASNGQSVIMKYRAKIMKQTPWGEALIFAEKRLVPAGYSV